MAFQFAVLKINRSCKVRWRAKEHLKASHDSYNTPASANIRIFSELLNAWHVPLGRAYNIKNNREKNEQS